jgi:hypothetical protein
VQGSISKAGDHDDWDAYRLEIVRLSRLAGRSGGLVGFIDVFGVWLLKDDERSEGGEVVEWEE